MYKASLLLCFYWTAASINEEEIAARDVVKGETEVKKLRRQLPLLLVSILFARDRETLRMLLWYDDKADPADAMDRSARDNASLHKLLAP
jgi:hypothetical protein